MKLLTFFSALWFGLITLFNPTLPNNVVLQGHITDTDGEALIGASVKVMQKDSVRASTLTDVEGKYSLRVAPGTYDIEFAYTGHRTLRKVNVVITQGENPPMHIVLETSVLEEVVVTGFRVNLNEGKDMRAYAYTTEEMTTAPVPASGAAPASTAGRHESDKKMRSRDVGAIKATSSEPKRSKPVPEPAKPASFSADDLKVADYEIAVDAAPSDAPITPGGPSTPKPRAGLLTAGEWSDLQNWNTHWVSLLADGEIAAHRTTYNFHPRFRYTVLLENQQLGPIVDATVQLKNTAGALIWETRSDNTGKAELWASMFDAKASEPIDLQGEVWIAGKKYDLGRLQSAEKGPNVHTLPVACDAPNHVDIVWAVDATGSMGDEIEYLKTELLDVIGRAKNNNPSLIYRMGTVFYRDQTDDYITKSSGLSEDISKTVDFIRKQFAGGGGDYPEAVHSALEEVIATQKWSPNAVARICFLVLDASPHQTPEVNASLQKSITEAARRGIRIVPIAASGIQKDTEFLMKFFGLATNGSYVFLTDHSGIGGKHLEPTTDEYKVEPLNDLLVRLITEYTSIESCSGQSFIRFEQDPQQPSGTQWQASYYPNPTAERFTLELPVTVQSVTLYNSEGVGVRKLENPPAGANNIQVNDLPAGFYTIRILSNGKMQSGKILVIRP
jgi:hypothetical protein